MLVYDTTGVCIYFFLQHCFEVEEEVELRHGCATSATLRCDRFVQDTTVSDGSESDSSDCPLPSDEEEDIDLPLLGEE